MINKKIISAITSLCMALSCMSFSVSVSAGKSSEVLMRPESSISNGAFTAAPPLPSASRATGIPIIKITTA